MKTIVKTLVAATMLVACYAVNAATINTNSNAVTVVENSDYEFVQTVAIYKIQKNIKVQNSAKLYKKDGSLYIYRNGEYCGVRSSDRSDYSYMFYDARGAWYFNY